MHPITRALSIVGAAGTLVMVPAANAAPASISAVIPKGDRLVALDSSGHSTASAPAKGAGTVRLTPPSTRFTLHIIAPNGRYAGPVVLAAGGAARTVVVGARAGAPLGRVKRVRGAFRAVVAARFLDTARTARADARGVPLGANTLGFVKATASGRSGPGNDLDLDGVPGAFDVDDDGDRVLDNLDQQARITQLPQPGGGGQAAPMPGGAPGGQGSGAPRIFSNLKVAIEESLNVNAGATRADIDRQLPRWATLAIAVPAGDAVELDCGALGYCSAGGTGAIMDNTYHPGSSEEPQHRFPDSADADGDGFGTITAGSTGDFQLAPRATSGQLGSGDTFIWRVMKDGVETQIPGVLNYAFLTTPALVRYRVNDGAETSVSYPVSNGAPGTNQNPVVVPATGDVKLTVALWRPQRASIPGSGEAGDWVDIGGLTYSVDLPNAPQGSSSPGTPAPSPGRGPGLCATSYFTGAGGGLEVGGQGLHDSATDAAPDPARTVSFTIDLTGCLASQPGVTWQPGQSLKVDFQAHTTDGDNGAQSILVRRASQ